MREPTTPNAARREPRNRRTPNTAGADALREQEAEYQRRRLHAARMPGFTKWLEASSEKAVVWERAYRTDGPTRRNPRDG
jgi:hypothetical protein